MPTNVLLSSGRSPSSKPCSTTWRGLPARPRPQLQRPVPLPIRSRMPRPLMRQSCSKPQRQRSALARRRAKARPSLIRCLAPSVSRRSTHCIASPAACGRGATISAMKARGRSNSATWWPPKVPTVCGRCSRRAKEAVMATELTFDAIRLPPECEALRKDVRAFIAKEIDAGSLDPHGGGIDGTYSADFSRKVGAKGWIGMTWPKKYGGHERSFLERYVVTEEFRVANAPVRLHFVADRQSGPILLRYAPEHIKADILPRICRGELCFVIGMSEPGSGSDLFAAKTKATKVDKGWRINGSKIWTSNAHVADYMLALFRTSPATEDNRRHGLTQFLVDMKTPGITVNPVYQMTGQHDFNEVVFQDAFVPDEYVLGEVDAAWKQATSELAYERSGPERFLETFYVLQELVRVLGPAPDLRGAEGLGRLVAQLHALRRMSVSVAGMLQARKEPVVEAAIVKDLGTLWEQRLPHRARDLAAFVEESAANRAPFEEQLRFATLIAPKLTIQGGTTEILRGIIARGLGLR